MLDDESKWQTVYNGSHTSVDEKIPIGEITIPGFFVSPTIRVYCTSLQAKFSWWLGGRLKHILGVATPDVVATRWNIPLKEKTLIIVPSLTTEYRLKFEPVKWLREIALVIEIYVE
jgi:hypothetical protein